MHYGTETTDELIHELETLRQQLVESEEKYHALTQFDAYRDGIVFCAMDGTIEDANQAYLDMLGYSLDEIRSLTCRELTPERWWSMEEDLRQNQVMTMGFCDEYEKEYVRKDGTVFAVSARVWLVNDDQGRPRRLLGIVREITR